MNVNTDVNKYELYKDITFKFIYLENTDTDTDTDTDTIIFLHEVISSNIDFLFYTLSTIFENIMSSCTIHTDDLNILMNIGNLMNNLNILIHTYKLYLKNLENSGVDYNNLIANLQKKYNNNFEYLKENFLNVNEKAIVQELENTYLENEEKEEGELIEKKKELNKQKQHIQAIHIGKKFATNATYNAFAYLGDLYKFARERKGYPGMYVTLLTTFIIAPVVIASTATACSVVTSYSIGKTVYNKLNNKELNTTIDKELEKHIINSNKNITKIKNATKEGKDNAKLTAEENNNPLFDSFKIDSNNNLKKVKENPSLRDVIEAYNMYMHSTVDSENYKFLEKKENDKDYFWYFNIYKNNKFLKKKENDKDYLWYFNNNINNGGAKNKKRTTIKSGHTLLRKTKHNRKTKYTNRNKIYRNKIYRNTKRIRQTKKR
jgi:hypothetical protein